RSNSAPPISACTGIGGRCSSPWLSASNPWCLTRLDAIGKDPTSEHDAGWLAMVLGWSHRLNGTSRALTQLFADEEGFRMIRELEQAVPGVDARLRHVVHPVSHDE